MANGNVGAGILNIITESLYDKPIVVFREYVQNSVDSFKKVEKENSNITNLSSKIWEKENNLYFLDNGNGIDRNIFHDKMRKIALSDKKKSDNIGYKGIGRLSGLPYCDKLIFVNICSYKNKIFQKYVINSQQYKSMKNDLNNMDFEDFMNEISIFNQQLKDKELLEMQSILEFNSDIFSFRDTGFLVILENTIKLFKDQTVNKLDFINQLKWLLPVKFKDDVLNSDYKLLFNDIIKPNPKTSVIPAQYYNISYNNEPLERPINTSMLRETLNTIDLKYATGFYSIYRNGIGVERGNIFSGIKIYLDNILLCDESELIPVLRNNGLINASANELIQSVRGIGAIIYITDKINISANARRTFIETTDNDADIFLKHLAEFVKNIYSTRYAISKYNGAKTSAEISYEKLDILRNKANEALKKLSNEQVTIELEDSAPLDFKEMNNIDKKNAIKKKLTNDMNQKIKEYLAQTSTFDYNNSFSNFMTWLLSNNK